MKYYKEFNIGNLLCAKNHETLKWGIFNPDLETVIPFEYDKIWPGFFSDNKTHYLVAVKDKMAGLINIDTKEFIPQKPYTLKEWEYQDISLIKEKDGKFGIVDAYGNFVIQPIYDKIEPWGFQTEEDCLGYNAPTKYEEKLYLVELNGKYGIANDSKVIKEPVFDDIAEGSEYVDRSYSYFEASKDGKYGYIDEFGNTVIDFKYEDVDTPFSLKLTVAKTFDNHLHFINLKTKSVIYDVAIDNIVNFTMEHNRICILTKSDNRYHLLDADGKILSEFENTTETDGKRFAYFNDAILESPDDELSLLYNMQGELLEFSEEYNHFTQVSGTTNFIAHKNLETDEMLDKDGNVLLTNMKGAYCVGNNEDDLGYPPVNYYIEGRNEILETDKSITPYEEIPETDSPREDNICVYDILKDNEATELINSDKQHYAYIISEKSIKVIDNKGNTTKEIAFNIEEGDADEDFEPEDYLE